MRKIIFLLIITLPCSPFLWGQKVIEGEQKGNSTYALIVGVSKYQHIRELNYAESDAQEFESYLRSKSGGNVPDGNIKTFYGAHANQAEIFSGIQYFQFAMRNKYLAGDRFFIYLSGHGGVMTNSKTGDPEAYFFSQDGVEEAGEDLNLNLNDIKALCATLTKQGVKVFLIFDACRTAEIGLKGRLKEVNQIVEDSKGEVILSATSKGDPAFESPTVRHGAFTWYLLRGLYGEADTKRDFKLTGRELERFIEDGLEHLDSIDHPGKEQNPFFNWGTESSKDEAKELFTYDVNEKVMVLARMDEELNNQTALAMNIAKVELKSSTQDEYDHFKSRFWLALKNEQVNVPPNDCALFYYRKLVPLSREHEAEIFDMRSELSLALIKTPRTVLSEDLQGRRGYLQKEQRIAEDKEASKISMRKNPKSNNLGYYGSAVADLKDYLEIVPLEERNPSVMPLLAYLKVREAAINTGNKKELARALQEINKAIIQYDYAYMHYAKGELLSKMADYNESNQSFHKALSLSPLWTYPYVGLVENFQRIGRGYAEGGIVAWEDSTTLYLGILRKMAFSDHKALSQIGNYLMERADSLYKYDSALIFLRKAALLAPERGEYWNSIGDAYYYSNRFDSAAVGFSRAISLSPSREIFFNLASTYYQMDSLGLAELYYLEALRIDDSYEEASADLGLVYYEMEDYMKSEVYLRKAIGNNKSNDQYYHSLGETLRAAGKVAAKKEAAEKYEKAIDAYQAAIKINPGNDDYYYHIAQSYHSMGQVYKEKPAGRKEYKRVITLYEKAISFIKKAIDIDPNYALYYDKKGHIYEDYFVLTSDDHELRIALDNFRMASQIDSTVDSYFADMARIFQNEEYTRYNYDSAISNYVRAFTIDSTYFDYPHKLGHLWGDAKKDNDKAIYYFKLALDLDPQARFANDVGNMLKAKETYDSAYIYYRVGIILDAEYAGNFSGMGDIHRVLWKQYDSAIYYHNTALSLGESEVKVYENLGYDYLDKGEFETSYKYFFMQLHLLLDLDSLGLRSELSYLTNKERSFEEKYLEYFYRRLEKGEAAFYNIACLFAAQANEKDALLWLRRALLAGSEPNNYGAPWSKLCARARGDIYLATLKTNPEFVELINRYQEIPTSGGRIISR